MYGRAPLSVSVVRSTKCFTSPFHSSIDHDYANFLLLNKQKLLFLRVFLWLDSMFPPLGKKFNTISGLEF